MNDNIKKHCDECGGPLDCLKYELCNSTWYTLFSFCTERCRELFLKKRGK